ncbi:MAG: type II toxin-antitoxin system prevent-host-death family antitoxin [Acidobacteria bacterium]|nr:type II toxin-antitoxin system prevent-host-death family antitoxin [Acidobacteriota bacterium]
MKSAKVSELKSALSAYLDEVRKGGSVVVCDRKTPIARIVPFTEDAGGLHIMEAVGSFDALPDIPRVRLRKGADVDRALAESRGRR